MTTHPAPLRIGSLCTGYGGLDTAVQAVLGGRLAWVADPDPGAAAILAHHHPTVPNLGDITTVDWHQVLAEHGPVDVAEMGFPCQDVSVAGLRAGIAPGTRSGLWAHCARAIHALNPRIVVIENVRGLLSQPADRGMGPNGTPLADTEPGPLRALGAVLGDLADLGFDAEWVGLPASDPRLGAPHERWREFILAWPATTHPDVLGRHRRSGNLAEAQGGHEPENRRHSAAPASGLSLLPTPAARDWKSGASNLMDTNARPLNEVVVNWLPRRGDWIATTGTDYGPAIRRWEQITGRPAPEPTEPGTRGNRRLSPAFSEWLMGLPAGHVTAVPGLDREAQLRAIGNGVVPRHAVLALRLLLARATTPRPAPAALATP